jgi:hypothetical protein
MVHRAANFNNFELLYTKTNEFFAKTDQNLIYFRSKIE